MRVKITLACTECKQRNYNMTKEKKAHPDRMETKKYWPDRQSLTKETVAVLAVSVLLGVIIAVVDLIVRFGIEFIVK